MSGLKHRVLRYLGYCLTIGGAVSPWYIAGRTCEEFVTYGVLVEIFIPLLVSVPFGIALLVRYRREGLLRRHAAIMAGLVAGISFALGTLVYRCQ